MFSVPPPNSNKLRPGRRRPTVNGSMEKDWSPALTSIFLFSMLMNFTWLSPSAEKSGRVF